MAEHFAQEALGHNNKAVHSACAKRLDKNCVVGGLRTASGRNSYPKAVSDAPGWNGNGSAGFALLGDSAAANSPEVIVKKPLEPI
jgi:hypothetical protein